MVVVGARSGIVSTRYRMGSIFCRPYWSTSDKPISPPRSSNTEICQRVGSVGSISRSTLASSGTMRVFSMNDRETLPSSARSTGTDLVKARSSLRLEPSRAGSVRRDRRSVPDPSSARISPRLDAYVGGITIAVAVLICGAGNNRMVEAAVSTSSVANEYSISSASVSITRSKRRPCCRVNTNRCQSLFTPSRMFRIFRKTRSPSRSPRTSSAAISSGSPWA